MILDLFEENFGQTSTIQLLIALLWYVSFLTTLDDPTPSMYVQLDV